MNNLFYHITHAELPFIKRRTGIELERLEQIKSSIDDLTYPELILFSKAFGLPISTLLADHNDISKTTAFFRKQQGSQKTSALVDKICLLIDGILQFSPAKSVDLSRIGSRVNDYENSEKIASHFRTLFLGDNQLESLIVLPELLAHLGVIIQVTELGDKVDGACARVDDINFIFLSPRFPARMLMSLAHELGHLINHMESDDFVLVEPQTSNDWKKHRLQEDFATHFASSLLIPAQGLAHLIDSFRKFYKIDPNKVIGDVEIIYVAHFYGLSFEAAAQRFEILGLIPEGGAHSLSERIKKDYGSPEKRAKALNITERLEINFKVLPKTLLNNVVSGLSDDKYSIGQVCQSLNLTINELHNLNKS